MRILLALAALAGLAACDTSSPFALPDGPRTLRLTGPVGARCVAATVGGDVVLEQVPGEIVLPGRYSKTPVKCVSPDGTETVIDVHRYSGPKELILEFSENGKRYKSVLE